MEIHQAMDRGSSRLIARRRMGWDRILATAITLGSFGLAFILAVPVAVHAQADPDLLGKRVVPKYRGFQLRIENRFIYPSARALYRVEQVDGHRLRLREDGRSLNGWTMADQVVPVEEAIDFFTDYIRANPKDPHGYIMRAIIWQEEEKELDIALRDYNEAIRLDTRNADIYSCRAEIWNDKKEYDEAIADFTRAIRLDPRLGPAYNNRGIDWSKKGEHDKALADFSAAIRLDPNVGAIYLNRGMSWSDKRQYDKAIADFNEAIRLDPRLALAYRRRGDAWLEKEEHDRAIADYSKAIRLDPRSAEVYHERGLAWSEKGDFTKAIADYSEAVRLDPHDKVVFNDRACAWQEGGDYDKAIADYTEAIRRDPAYALAYHNRGTAWGDKKEYGRAIADYTRAIGLDPKFGLGYSDRAWIWATCPDATYRDGNKAVLSATKACELSNWTDAQNLDCLAAAYSETGDFEAALKWQRKANALHDDAESKSMGEVRLKLYAQRKPCRVLGLPGHITKRPESRAGRKENQQAPEQDADRRPRRSMLGRD
jgi:tetratricopeptide (TPR) repeat protein